MHQHFFIEGRYLGQVERGFDLTRGMLPDSILLYCECCGETWAKFPVEGRPFIGYKRMCRRCKSEFRSQLPGSVWLIWDHEFLAVLPLAVLLWEFEREFDFYRRTDGSANRTTA